MVAYDEVIKMIKQEIDDYPVSEFGEVLIEPPEIDRFPDPEEFSNPKPDIEWEGPLDKKYSGSLRKIKFFMPVEEMPHFFLDNRLLFNYIKQP